MKYKCLIQAIDDETITIQVENTTIIGFTNLPLDFQLLGEFVEVEIELIGDLKIKKDNVQTKTINSNTPYSYSCTICGILDVENKVVKSEIDFTLDENILYEYGYLDKQYIEIIVPRVDFHFE